MFFPEFGDKVGKFGGHIQPFANLSPTFRQLFANLSPTFRQLFANLSPTFRQPFFCNQRFIACLTFHRIFEGKMRWNACCEDKVGYDLQTRQPYLQTRGKKCRVNEFGEIGDYPQTRQTSDWVWQNWRWAELEIIFKLVDFFLEFGEFGDYPQTRQTSDWVWRNWRWAELEIIFKLVDFCLEIISKTHGISHWVCINKRHPFEFAEIGNYL